MKKIENFLTAAGEVLVALLFQMVIIPVIVIIEVGECFPDSTEAEYPVTSWVFGGLVATVVAGIGVGLCLIWPALYLLPPLVWGVLRYKELERYGSRSTKLGNDPCLVRLVGKWRLSSELLRRVENTLRWVIVGIALIPGQIGIGLAGGMYVAERYGDNSRYPNSTLLLCWATTFLLSGLYGLFVAMAPVMLAVTPVLCWLGLFIYEHQLELRLTLKTEGG